MIPESTIARLDELGKLEAGWLDGAGERITEYAVAEAKFVLDSLDALGVDVSIFSVFPTEEGGISIEAHRKSEKGTYRSFYFAVPYTSQEDTSFYSLI